MNDKIQEENSLPCEDVKLCKYCGCKIIRKEGQSPSAYKRLVFCSGSCSTRSTKNNIFKEGKQHPNYNGGSYIDVHGYRCILVGNSNYRKEHIIVMEREVGRKLKKNEVVHHINGMKDDNRVANLMVMDKGDHNRLHTTGIKRTQEQIDASKLLRMGFNQKEQHQQWKQWITKDIIVDALKLYKTKAVVAQSIGVCADTLRNRMKYYGIQGGGTKNGK